MLYTAQYRYPGQDRLDITVKGNNVAGKIYAPTWDMVMGVKNGRITEEDYTNLYYDMIIEKFGSSKDFRDQTLRLVAMVSGTKEMPERDMTLVCFCPSNAFCHRFLLVNWITHNWPEVKYGGERTTL